MKLTKARLQQIIKEEIDAVSEAEADGELPPNIMTVDKMIEALSKIPGDTPVAYSHEFGTMNIKNIYSLNPSNANIHIFLLESVFEL